jgi:Glycosyl hydrolase family 12
VLPKGAALSWCGFWPKYTLSFAGAREFGDHLVSLNGGTAVATARRVVIVVVVILLGAVLSGSAVGAQGTVATSVACGLSQRITQQASGGVQVISRPNAFDVSGQRLCISGTTRRPGFKVLDNLRYTGAWQAYPFTGAGCAYNLCSPHTDMPMQVRRLPGNANTSFSWRGSQAPGNWNASYDIWFDHDDQTTAQDDGAELMIWLRPNPGYKGGVRVRIAKRQYWFMHWRTCQRAGPAGVTPPRAGPGVTPPRGGPEITPPRAGPGAHAGICWNYVQFRFLSVVHGVQRLWLMPFIRFLEGQDHLVRGSWWLTSVHAGYELVSGGKGLHTTWFNVHI